MFAKLFLFSAALLAAAGVNAQVNPTSADCARNYTVVSGDNCDAICAAQKVPTYQFFEVNKNTVDVNCSNLSVNEALCLASTTNNCVDVHNVVAGDSCLALIKKYSIPDSKTLLSNNPQVNAQCTNINIGQVLCVAKTVVVTPAAPASTA